MHEGTSLTNCTNGWRNIANFKCNYWVDVYIYLGIRTSNIREVFPSPVCDDSVYLYSLLELSISNTCF